MMGMATGESNSFPPAFSHGLVEKQKLIYSLLAVELGDKVITQVVVVEVVDIQKLSKGFL
nr:MAG TPA: hypothetical protein [Caudoviricetes sp.]